MEAESWATAQAAEIVQAAGEIRCVLNVDIPPTGAGGRVELPVELPAGGVTWFVIE